MYLFMLSMLALFLIVGAGVLVFGKKAKTVRVGEVWKLFFALILIGTSRGMSGSDPLLLISKMGMLVFGCTLLGWFVGSLSVPATAKRVNSHV